VTVAVIAILPFIIRPLFAWLGGRTSEPEIKFIFLVLFALGGLANLGKSEAVLPAYLVGMALAPFFLANRELQLRMRAICFAFLTPFYFLNAGLDRRRQSHRAFSRHEDDHKILRHPAVDPLFQF
jgi:Kef-type K+ transport system membrane component KefB